MPGALWERVVPTPRPTAVRAGTGTVDPLTTVGGHRTCPGGHAPHLCPELAKGPLVPETGLEQGSPGASEDCAQRCAPRTPEGATASPLPTTGRARGFPDGHGQLRREVTSE